MGLNLISFSCRRAQTGTPKAPDPNPKKFTIVGLHEFPPYTVAIVNYKGCTTYGGNKISVYRATKEDIQSAKELDPHFLGNGGLEPIARFPASTEGLETAVLMVKVLNKLGQ